MKILQNLLTARDNITYSLTKLLGLGAAVEMFVKFAQVDVPDYVGFGTGIAAIMAALAVKYYAEGTGNASQSSKD